MNFTLYEVDNPKRLKKLSVNKVNFFKKHEDVELFHFNEIEKEMFHIVYHIKDEYQLGTKRVGNQMNLPFTQFINCFFFLESNSFLVEEVLEEYQKDVTLQIQKKANVTIQRKAINNDHFLSVYTSLSGFIKKLEYVDEEESDFYLDSVDEDKFQEIVNEYKVDRLTMSVDEQFVSIYSNGRISVDNSDENYLIKFTRKIINAINDFN
ncbi:hypothetical protein LC085_21500 [Bacillus tianshenii]|uniref:hypothetical protein n=1 Tax=Sutcliffiella tianshenii TaxID=1463404 RepID=UPI001CD7FB66|nr:hypothetical protein [Bacillus tianshenii]MCA1322455.1 hypothetical protein [Bacillus tianshenii]